jgi:glutamyl-tRNA synthetase
LDALRAEQSARGESPGYDSRCRDLALGADCGSHVIRLRVEPGVTTIPDLIKGDVSFDHAELDDWILVRSDGSPTYNFVVVIDDVAMQITHVLRGDEHLNNTPKQWLVYEALGMAPPRFGHMPLILALDGTKLSKRHGVTSVGAYRDLGIHPEALVNYLARLGWSHGDQELFTRDELVAAFSIEGIGKSPGKWDMDKLNWVNAQWQKTLPLATVAERAGPFLSARSHPLDARLPAVVAALRERAPNLVALAEAADFVYAGDSAVVKDEDAVAAVLLPARDMVRRLGGVLAGVGTWGEPTLEAAVTAFVAAEGTKLGKLAQPVRVALTGQKVGPGLYTTLALLGRETSLRRLERCWGAA